MLIIKNERERIMITAEEFIKSKIRRRDNITGGMFGLWYYKLNAEEAESWMIEFAEKQANEAKPSDERESLVCYRCKVHGWVGKVVEKKDCEICN